MLTPLALLDEVVAAKIESPYRPPLNLQYQDRHYSAFIHSGRTSRLPEFEAEMDLVESTALGQTEHSTRPPIAPTGMTDATQQAAPMSVSAILCPAPLESDHFAATDGDTCTYHFQVLVVVEHRLVLPELPLTHPLGPRLTPPPDHKRGISTSPEEDQSTGEIVPYQPETTVHKKGRVGVAPPTIITDDVDYYRIDRGDWASAWKRLISH
uniref:Uncharacterized protein n=1 Tax=Peronospora matthiolae TaxID=2874970 RepID=A0AAV1USD9_9STRA